MTVKKGIKSPKKRKPLIRALGVGGGSKNKSLRHGSIYGSDATFCPKKVALHLAVPYNYNSQPASPASEFYFAIGHAVHSIVDNRLSSLSAATELKVEAYGIRGRIDNIIYDDDGLKIVDTKTCGRLPTKIRPSHYEQVLTYCLLSGITRASVLYFSRNVADYRGNLLATEIVIDVDDDTLANSARAMAESITFMREQAIPDYPQPRRPNKTSCGFCPFKYYCWEDEPLGWSNNDWFRLKSIPKAMERKISLLTTEILDAMMVRNEQTKKLIKQFGTRHGKAIIGSI